jgi:hypothetical protein
LSCSEVPNNSTLVLWINKIGPVFQQAQRIWKRHPDYFFGGVGGLLSRPLLDEIPCLVEGQPARSFLGNGEKQKSMTCKKKLIPPIAFIRALSLNKKGAAVLNALNDTIPVGCKNLTS